MVQPHKANGVEVALGLELVTVGIPLGRTSTGPAVRRVSVCGARKELVENGVVEYLDNDPIEAAFDNDEPVKAKRVTAQIPQA